ncbi:MAG: hypothetical protein LUH42_04970 [Oscillospiraceae bacterium]|nr:hypothetical protein [Oscillospiraceae bacterium]
MKKSKLLNVVLYGLCAVIWTVRVVVSVVCREYDYYVGIFSLNILVALIWIAAFVKWLLRYRSEKDESGR